MVPLMHALLLIWFAKNLANQVDSWFIGVNYNKYQVDLDEQYKQKIGMFPKKPWLMRTGFFL